MSIRWYNILNALRTVVSTEQVLNKYYVFNNANSLKYF